MSIYPPAHVVIAGKVISFLYLNLVCMLVEKQVLGKKEKIHERLAWAIIANVTEVQKRSKGVYVMISSLLTCYRFRG